MHFSIEIQEHELLHVTGVHSQKNFILYHGNRISRTKLQSYIFSLLLEVKKMHLFFLRYLSAQVVLFMSREGYFEISAPCLEVGKFLDDLLHDKNSFAYL